jgi:hypothetical protein
VAGRCCGRWRRRGQPHHHRGYVARIAEKNQERGAGAGGFFINNVIVFAESRLRGYVDMGAGSPALAQGRDVPRGLVADFERREYGQPPNRGAFAGQ